MKKNIDFKAQALLRMKYLNMSDRIIDKFKYDDVVLCSCKNELLDLTTNELKIVNYVEQSRGGLIYHCVRYEAENKEIFVCLYISSFEEEWLSDIQEILTSNKVFVYYSDLKFPKSNGFKVSEVISINDVLKIKKF